MKKMSCFCASNSSGDSVYSGYFRWRMGLPLPPIPQEEESHVLKNTNKDIFNDIIGVKHASDFTLDEPDVDNTPRRFRRRKNQDTPHNPAYRLFASRDNIKDFRENPMYIGSIEPPFHMNEESPSLIKKSIEYYPMKDEIFVPSETESFINNFGVINNNFKNCGNTNLPGDSISSFLVKKFLGNIEDYSENSSAINMDEDNISKNVNNNQVSTRLMETIKLDEFKEPPAIPPHRKPSTIIEESESENDTIQSLSESIEKENIELLPIDNKIDEHTNSTIASIPIFSIKHGDIDKILSESIGEYDYAYNKSWSKGVEFNLSMNLSGDKKSKRIKTAHQSSQCKKERSDFPINNIKDDNDFLEDETNDQNIQPLNVSIDSFTDETDDSNPVHSFPETSPIPFLKLSSIEADAMKPSPTTLSRTSQVSSFFAESETDSRNEPWDVIHGRSIKELIGTRFIDPSVINNNKPAPTRLPSVEDSKNNPSNKTSNRLMNSNSESKLTKDSLKRFHININAKIPLEKQPWYHFYLTRSKAESLLLNHPDGSFLVRRSESNKNAYSLTIKHKNLFLHMKITKNQKGFVLGEYSQPYQSIPHMLYHYCLTMVPVKGAEAACLRFAVTRDHSLIL